MWVSTLDGISVVDMAQTAVGCRLESIIRLVMMNCFFYLFDGNHGGQLNTCQFWTVNNTSITTMSHGSFLYCYIQLNPPLPNGIDIAFKWMLYWRKAFWLEKPVLTCYTDFLI
jgi:hypothetical protein